ncbi:rubredoxin [Niabella ginsengisoli]|uniref:Rubredoxin n=1 Tax=Niabella ginsengisoli TaxID=522298 RepID=A0ABS9SJL7_9BACT|nr:rubredoxin [Niabella ginsengisoli]MCH5598553.1 rubredoxin [Niabella ginsengisoli]
MKNHHTVKINFKGGIISPGELMDILNIASQWGVKQVRFGLRQQLLIDVEGGLVDKLAANLDALDIIYEIDKDDHPNIVSSYPAEEVFINNTWLGEGVYKDILDELDHNPKLKINISDSNQSFTPLLTGNINWVASPSVPHFWHLFIRFPKTNSVFEWNEMVYTNDVSNLSKEIESIIYRFPDQFIDKEIVNGEKLFSLIKTDQFITKPVSGKMVLPDFNLPYYEGLNRHNNKYWLGVYRRSEMFPVAFLKNLCRLCLDTKVGQLCSTPWKSVIIKGIEETDKQLWGDLLDKHQINMRHPANELNFQVQDNDYAARKLKNYLVQKLNTFDARTFGVCIGIKTQKKSEIFSSILIRRKPLFELFGKEIFHVYDILCAKDFNPNERTGTIFISNISRLHLASELQKAVLWFYKNRNKKILPSQLT